MSPGDSISGNVLDNDVKGADGARRPVCGRGASRRRYVEFCGTHLGDPIYGQYGYLTLDAQATPPTKTQQDWCRVGVDTFVYTIRDADGDESTTTISVKVLDNKSWSPAPTVK
jgi:hypothetical protein